MWDASDTNPFKIVCPKIGRLVFQIGLVAGMLLGSISLTSLDLLAQTTSGQGSTPPITPPIVNATQTGDLQWQPGLGKPLIMTGSTQPNRLLAPPKALPVMGAQPLQGNSQQANGAPVPQDYSLVVPAAFLESGAAGATANPRAATGGHGNVIDSRITTVTQGMDVLPNAAGQIWRTYDISPYTYAIQTTDRPQQAVVDWILKETGTEMWFQEPMGVMNATRDHLHIYHTPEVHARVKAVVDRMVQTRGNPHVMGLRLVTVSNPNWRSAAFSMMQPIEVASPGVEAWLVSKENAAVLANQLRNRSDYQEHNLSDLIVNDGQKYVMSKTRPISFLRSLAFVNDGAPRYQPINGRIDEGYSLEISSLRSLDGRMVEVIVGCKVDQIEKMQDVNIDLPTMSGTPQTVKLQIPQMVSWNVDERFRWPSDQVLLLSCGVVATPGPQPQGIMGITSIFDGTRRRADALMFIEYKGPAQNAPPPGNRNANSGPGMMPINPQR